MRKTKVISIFIVALVLISILGVSVFASNEDTTLEKVQDNICTIQLGEDGTVTKKLVSVDNEKKEVTLQVDVKNNNEDKTEVIPSEVYLVIDNSKSMLQEIETGVTRRSKVFAAAKTLATNILEAQSSSKVGVVSFSTNSDFSLEGTISDANLVTKATNDITTITTGIDGIQATGDRTDIDAGLQVAKNNISTDTTTNKYIILLTDGVPNTAVGGPTQTYSGEVTTKTKATLKSIIDAGINIATVMTGVDSTYQPDPTGATSASAAGKTYQNLAEEVFGTEANPSYGSFYYVSDANVETTIVNKVYIDVTKYYSYELKNITVVDYFPDEIINNFNYEIVENANIGSVSAEVSTTSNSITWTIETLKASETASFKYKLILKDSYDSKILNTELPTNKGVDVTYNDPNGDSQSKTSDVTPTIILKKDTTIAQTTIPQTGDIISNVVLSLIGIIGLALIGYTLYIRITNRNK